MSENILHFPPSKHKIIEETISDVLFDRLKKFGDKICQVI